MCPTYYYETVRNSRGAVDPSVAADSWQTIAEIVNELYSIENWVSLKA